MAESKNLGNKKLSSSLSAAYAFIVLFGVVSLFSDMTHEGARRAGNTEPGTGCDAVACDIGNRAWQGFRSA